jgi:hypothetical protein
VSGLELVACEVFGGVIGSDKAKQIFLPPFKTGSRKILLTISLALLF